MVSTGAGEAEGASSFVEASGLGYFGNPALRELSKVGTSSAGSTLVIFANIKINKIYQNSTLLDIYLLFR